MRTTVVLLVNLPSRGNERCLRYSDADIAYWNDDKHKPEKYYKVRCGFSNVKARQAWYIIDSEVKPCASTCKEWCEDKGGPVPVFWSKCGDDPYTRLNSDRKVETLTLTPNEEKKRPACLGS